MGEVEMGCQLASDLFSLFFCITRYPMLPLLNLRPRLPAPADEFHLGTLQLLPSCRWAPPRSRLARLRGQPAG